MQYDFLVIIATDTASAVPGHGILLRPVNCVVVQIPKQDVVVANRVKFVPRDRLRCLDPASASRA